MQPDNVTIGDGLFELYIIIAETLSKSLLPITPARHPEKIIWGRQDEED
jgi:hypothetical protein